MTQYKAVELSACGRWLEVDLGIPHSTLGWTLIGGGRRQAQRVFWHHVSDADLPPELDAKRLFEDRRRQRAGDTQGVGFLTGCRLAGFVEQRPSGIGNAIATGTGTDCIVVASPLACSNDFEVCFTGKHTEFGHLIGACVYDAVSQGIRRP